MKEVELVIEGRLRQRHIHSGQIMLVLDFAKLADMRRAIMLRGQEPTKLIVEITGIATIFGIPVEFRAKEGG